MPSLRVWVCPGYSGRGYAVLKRVVQHGVDVLSGGECGYGGVLVTSDEIIRRCLAKPGTFLDYPFGPDSTIVKVKSQNGPARIFAQLFMLKGEPMATFNCDSMTGEIFRNIYPGSVTRGYHCPPVQQPYFNTVRLDGAVPDDVLIHMIEHAYSVVVGKLPKKYQRELAMENREDERP